MTNDRAGIPYGDFEWNSEDGETEGVLQLCSDGKWWHSIHWRATERVRIVQSGSQREELSPRSFVDVAKEYKEQGLGNREADKENDLKRLAGNAFEATPVLEIAECLGSWREVVAESDKGACTEKKKKITF